MTKQRPASLKNSDPQGGWLSTVVILFDLTALFICLGVVGLALNQAGYLPGISSLINPTTINPTTTPVTAIKDLSCQDLINQAMLISGNNCDHVGPNQVCYGNITIQADLLPNANEPFANVGDVVDVQLVQLLSTAPLDLQKKEWGIAIFNIIANLPRSLPGEAVKMVVFGNTTIGNNGIKDIQSFYFSSELGQIVCNEVPFDGIMITMPDGTGVRLMINGSELTLMGNASLRAVKNESMDVSLYSGTASITANNQTQFFGAGQRVQVPLGGVNGTDSIGGPSLPTTLSSQELTLACTLAGTSCSSVSLIPTVNSQDAQATLSSFINGTPFPAIIPVIPTTAIAPIATQMPTAIQIQPTPRPVQPTPKPVKEKNTPPGLIKKTPKP
jgi:hypothetical protein